MLSLVSGGATILMALFVFLVVAVPTVLAEEADGGMPAGVSSALPPGLDRDVAQLLIVAAGTGSRTTGLFADRPYYSA